MFSSLLAKYPCIRNLGTNDKRLFTRQQPHSEELSPLGRDWGLPPGHIVVLHHPTVYTSVFFWGGGEKSKRIWEEVRES